jgi:hypothetical protein
VNAIREATLPVPLLRLARRVRHAVEETTVDVEGIETDLGGACALASQALVAAIRRSGRKAVFVYGVYFVSPLISGRGWAHEHCWVETSGHIVDLTATQFGNISDEIHVCPRHAAEYDARAYGAAALRWVHEKWEGLGGGPDCQQRIREILRRGSSQ